MFKSAHSSILAFMRSSTHLSISTSNGHPFRHPQNSKPSPGDIFMYLVGAEPAENCPSRSRIYLLALVKPLSSSHMVNLFRLYI